MSGPRVRPSRSNSMATYRPFSGNNGALGRLIDHLPGPNFISTRFTRPLLSRWSSFRERAYEFRQLLRSESAGPKKRLLIISIPYYDDAWGNLEGAKSDWKIWAMLGEMAGWDVEILTDTDTDIGRFEAPTPENIEKYIRYMLKGNKKADQFVVAYSGHGDAQGLVMADGISHVSPQNLQEWLLEPLNSGALLWTIFDCCESMNLLGLPHRLRQEISGIRYEALTNRSNSTRGTVISIGSSAGSAGEVNLSDAPSSSPPIQSGTLAFIANRFFTPKARAGTGEPLLADYLTLLGKLLQKRPGQEAQVTTSAILSEPVMPSLFAPPS